MCILSLIWGQKWQTSLTVQKNMVWHKHAVPGIIQFVSFRIGFPDLRTSVFWNLCKTSASALELAINWVLSSSGSSILSLSKENYLCPIGETRPDRCSKADALTYENDSAKYNTHKPETKVQHCSEKRLCEKESTMGLRAYLNVKCHLFTR